MLEQKAKRTKAFKCEACIKTEKVWCSQTFTSSRRYDRLQWGRNTLELPKILDWIVNFTKNSYSRCRSDREHLITRRSWKLRIVNTIIDYDDRNNQLNHDGHILPCYHSDGFCKPTTKTPYTLTWFNEKFCPIFQIQEFIGRMTRIKDRYWIETDTFIEASNITQKFQTEGKQGTKFPNVKTPQSPVDNPSLSRFEI